MPKVFCACGQPLHYTDARHQTSVEKLIADTSPDVEVRTPSGSWVVPRHYIALHGLKASELPTSRFPQRVNDHTILVYFLHDEGGVHIRLDRQDFLEQIFHHVDPDDERQRHFYIPKLRQMIKREPAAFKLTDFRLSEEQAQFVITNHGVEEAHIARLSDDNLDEPGIMCMFGDGSQLVVDGNHRLVARVRRQCDSMAFWMLPEAQWKKALLKAPSGFDLT